MKTLTIIFALLVSTSLLGCASTSNSQSLYDEIGGRPVLGKVMRITVQRIYEDETIGHFFKGVPKRHLFRMLNTQVCELIGGPCEYKGRSMKDSHADLDITDKDFYILVEHLQVAMRETGLTHQQENQILQVLAPLKDDIVYQ